MPCVRLAADRLERERAVARAVVPDRRERRRRDGELRVEVADRREDAWSPVAPRRASSGERRRRWRRNGRRAADPNAVRSKVTRPSTADDRGDERRGVGHGAGHDVCARADVPLAGSAAKPSAHGSARECRLHPAPRRGGGATALRSSRWRGSTTIRIPRWIQLVALPVVAAPRVPPRAHARTRPLSLPHRRRDRVHAQSARPRAARGCACRAGSRSRSCTCLRHGVRGRARRPRDGRRPETRSAADRIDAYLTEEDGHRSDRGRGRRRPVPGLARRPRARGDQDPRSSSTTSPTRSAPATSRGTSRTRSRSSQGAAFSVILLLFSRRPR